MQAVLRVLRFSVPALGVTASPSVSLLGPPAVVQGALIAAGAVAAGGTPARTVALPSLATHRRARRL
ncbi:MAG: hypothetical protein M3303_05805, partial [Gemmatimonadota bacterium]|nr:hypothetical protein [Gemmatimonadota bacterium]